MTPSVFNHYRIVNKDDRVEQDRLTNLIPILASRDNRVGYARRLQADLAQGGW